MHISPAECWPRAVHAESFRLLVIITAGLNRRKHHHSFPKYDRSQFYILSGSNSVIFDFFDESGWWRAKQHGKAHQLNFPKTALPSNRTENSERKDSAFGNRFLRNPGRPRRRVRGRSETRTLLKAMQSHHITTLKLEHHGRFVPNLIEKHRVICKRIAAI